MHACMYAQQQKPGPPCNTTIGRAVHEPFLYTRRSIGASGLTTCRRTSRSQFEGASDYRREGGERDWQVSVRIARDRGDKCKTRKNVREKHSPNTRSCSHAMSVYFPPRVRVRAEIPHHCQASAVDSMLRRPRAASRPDTQAAQKRRLRPEWNMPGSMVAAKKGYSAKNAQQELSKPLF